MGLFSTLQATRSSSSTTTAITVNSLDVPTVVQLFSETPLKLIDASSSSSSSSSSSGGLGLPSSWPKPWKVMSLCQVPKWACVSYQTVQTFESTMNSSKVDLGVWNVKCLPAANMTDALLQQIPVCRKFVITIDLSQPNNVEPRLTQMQQALVRFLITNRTEITDPDNTNEQEAKETDTTAAAATIVTTTEAEETAGGASASAADETSTTTTTTTTGNTTANETTSLCQLRSVQFGVATEDASANKTTNSEDADKKVTIALLICAMVSSSAIPKTSKDQNSDNNDTDKKKKTKDAQQDEEEDEFEDYQAKQTRALLVYHLRKYAMLLNCSLVFCNVDIHAPPVTSSASTTALSSTTPPLLNLHQTTLLWREFALGHAIWNEYQTILELEPHTVTDPAAAPALEGDEDQQHQQPVNEVVTPLVVGPGTYQQDLLETVLLRNAQNPGHWDAAKSSVWEILPYEDENELSQMTNTTLQTPKASQTGDQSWLSQLRDSLDGGAAAAADDATVSTVSTMTTATTKPEGLTIEALGLKTPEPKQKPKPKKPATKKPAVATPGTTSKADTAAFFESLLK